MLKGEESESANLQSFQFSYSEVQFIIVVNGLCERILKKSVIDQIYFESESIKITPDISKPTSNIIIKNKTKNEISYSIMVLPWIDPSENIILEMESKFKDIGSVIKDKLFPFVEFSPLSNSSITFQHNLNIPTPELSIRILDYSAMPQHIPHILFGKFIGNEFKYENISITASAKDPKNSIELNFLGDKKPGFCSLRIEGRSLILEILDSSNKDFVFKNGNLNEGTTEIVKHDIDVDFSKILANIKLEYLVSGRAVRVPGNLPKKASFTRVGSKLFLNVFEDSIIGEGNFSVSVDEENNNLIFSNEVDLNQNNLESIGYSLELNIIKFEITAHIELSQLSRRARSISYEYIN